jgi:enoyl-CoA hydratase/carnithine racemase
LRGSGVAVLTLDSPPLKLTTLVTLDKLMAICRNIAAEEKVRAVVVVGREAWRSARAPISANSSMAR